MRQKVKDWIRHLKEFEIPIFVLRLKRTFGLI